MERFQLSFGQLGMVDLHMRFYIYLLSPIIYDFVFILMRLMILCETSQIWPVKQHGLFYHLV